MRKTETSEHSRHPLPPTTLRFKIFRKQEFHTSPPFSIALTHRSPASPDYTNDGQRLRDKPTETC